MVNVQSVLTFNQRQIDNFTSGGNSAIVRKCEDYVRRTTRTAKAFSPTETGLMRASITGSVHREPRRVVGKVTIQARYGIFVSLGTGIYGPRHHMLYPQHGKVFRFPASRARGPKVRGARRELPRARRAIVFASHTRGIPYNHFLIRALKANVPNVTVLVGVSRP